MRQAFWGLETLRQENSVGVLILSMPYCLALQQQIGAAT